MSDTSGTVITPPKRRAPPGTVDCHMHIFGPTGLYPYGSQRSYTPPEALMPAYQNMCETVGIDRTVVVHPSVYGNDNSCSADAVTQMRENARGVCVIDMSASDADIRALHDKGFRGVRFNIVSGGGTAVDELEAIAARIAQFDWHIQLYVKAELIYELEERLLDLPLDIVIDHLGGPEADGGIEQLGFQSLLRLLQANKAWVKLSGAYRTDSGDSPWPASDPFARALVATRADRCVFGSDWPHPSLSGPMPDDGKLFDKLCSWCDEDESLIEQICVRNPVRLYGF